MRVMGMLLCVEVGEMESRDDDHGYCPKGEYLWEGIQFFRMAAREIRSKYTKEAYGNGHKEHVLQTGSAH